MSDLALPLEGLGRSDVARVGGKAAGLGEVARVPGVRVPGGWCVTTEAFRRVLAAAPGSVHAQLARLPGLDPDDAHTIRDVSARVRIALEGVAVPAEVAAAVATVVDQLGDGVPCAVRSSSTAEDLPTASYAGQHDTFLDVTGRHDVLDRVRRCWASLFSERAIAYRLRAGLDHQSATMAVVIQRMLAPRVSGVLFTADPTSGHRRVAAVEAVGGLGEALVAGRVTPHRFLVRDGDGGSHARVVEARGPGEAPLTEPELLELVRVGRRIEAHLGAPQDIEWCLVDGQPWVVQSRPITTLFPIPEFERGGNRVFVSVGHQQMMTDAMKPLGLSVWQRTSPAPMRIAGSRLFVDVTDLLASPATRDGMVASASTSDPLTGHALRTLVERADFLPEPAGPAPAPPPGARHEAITVDPTIVPDLIARAEASIDALAADLTGRSGLDLLDAIDTDLQDLRTVLFAPDSHQAVMAGMQAAAWLNEHLHTWLGETNAADTLAQSVPHNVTAQMGLALMEVADRIRPHPEVVDRLAAVEEPGWLDELADVPGGAQAADAIRGFLAAYGARCAGEIDITRPRWADRPSLLVPTILTNVRTFEEGAGRERFERGRQRALAARDELLTRLRELPDGEAKATETDRMIGMLRGFTGYREFPKFAMVRRYHLYRQALMADAARLVEAGVLAHADDIHDLTFDELRDVVRDRRVDHDLLARRRAAFRDHQHLTPPRVITSDGEVVTGSYDRVDVPPDTLIGLAVASGTAEGRARVVASMAEADLEPGDILVTAFTDPSWTPVFVAIAGLVTEVGGLMTHGAVIAREYGLPAVVGVADATRRIRDGQRIRVDGTTGRVTLLQG